MAPNFDFEKAGLKIEKDSSASEAVESNNDQNMESESESEILDDQNDVELSESADKDSSSNQDSDDESMEEAGESELEVSESDKDSNNVVDPKTETDQQPVKAWQPSFKRRQETNDDQLNSSKSEMMVKEAEKELRPVLNRVSEGNIDPMF